MPLPERLECGLEQVFRFDVALEQLTRASEVMADPGGEVHADGRTWVDAHGRTRLTGRVTGTGRLICQRCLEPFDWAFDQPVDVALVGSDEEAAALPEMIDPMVVERGQLVVLDWLEDEVLLAVPLVPVHPEVASCEGRRMPIGVEREQRSLPFAGLAKLVESKSR